MAFAQSRQLELTDKQLKAWRDLQAEQSKAASALFKNKDLSAQDKYKQNAELRKQYDVKRLDVLTKAQRKKLKELQGTRAKQWAEARKPLPERLGFSDKQQAEYDALNKNAMRPT